MKTVAFKRVMWKRFLSVHGEYVSLRRSTEEMKAELAKTKARIELLVQLLALEGETVNIGAEVQGA